VSLEAVHGFDLFGCRECPAGSALSLVVDRGDARCRPSGGLWNESPVPEASDLDLGVVEIEVLSLDDFEFWLFLHEVEVGEFFWGDVRELGDSELGDSLGLLGHSLGSVHAGGEDSESELFLSLGFVLFSIDNFELVELLFGGSLEDVACCSEANKKSEEYDFHHVR